MLLQIIYFVAVLHVSTLFFSLLKNQIFGKFAFEMTSWGVKNVPKTYAGGGGLLETCESIQREEGDKNCVRAL